MLWKSWYPIAMRDISDEGNAFFAYRRETMVHAALIRTQDGKLRLRAGTPERW